MRWLSIALLTVGCTYVPQTRVTPMISAYQAASASPQGDLVSGRENFVKFRCNACHSVAGETPAAQIPLPDLSRETPDAVANMIVSRTKTAPEALFDEMAMSAAASQLRGEELADIVAYLRHPAAANRRSP